MFCLNIILNAIGHIKFKSIFTVCSINFQKENLFSSQDWQFDTNELENLFNEKTKMIIINSPHNPTGKVFTKTELQIVADLCIKWDVLCISDEVYEWMVYKPNKHERIGEYYEFMKLMLSIFNITFLFEGTVVLVNKILLTTMPYSYIARNVGKNNNSWIWR